MRDIAKEAVRRELVDRLRLELVGPNAEAEELAEAPSSRYLCGILSPADSLMDAAENQTDDSAGGDDDESTGFEVTAPLAQSMKPSSIGLSFIVEPACTEIQVETTWGSYSPVGEKRGDQERWQREAAGDSVVLPLVIDAKRQKRPSLSDPNVYYEWIARDLKGRTAVSLFLVNRKAKPEKGSDDGVSLFQAVLQVRSTVPGVSPFVAREVEAPEGQVRLDDTLQDELLYRHERVFAVGHGTAAEWSVSPDGTCADRISTVTIPEFDLPRVIPPDWDRGGCLDMAKLGGAGSGNEIVEYLMPVAQAYDTWISTRKRELTSLQSSLDPDLFGRGQVHLNLCQESLERIRSGLTLIATDPLVFEAFTFANRTMATQRTQAKWAQQWRKAKNWSTTHPVERSEWRPFQIAFILQAILSVAQPEHDDRKLADLLWFPTGGGKTEAYLGLSAFTMALRRLRRDQTDPQGGAGVTVIMRYTLRLLTIQQFQRAATLICACELERQANPQKWGEEPFRLGLWVGSGSTPNTFDECEKVLTAGHTGGGATPVQLVACPWCGSPLDRKDYFAFKKQRRVLIGCSNPRCDFHREKNAEGLPAIMEDEEIYRLVPSLVIGTVDKFARIPWMAETGALFGHVTGYTKSWGFVVEGEDENTQAARQTMAKSQPVHQVNRLLPPELIIQDELHLISGPLGTVVGAYETAIDLLCSRQVDGRMVGPKVIASTATIRKADEQVNGLFERRAVVFPPPGLTAGDSFFAQAQSLEKASGRLYLGVFAPGRSVKTALVRVYSTLLASLGEVDAAPKDLDPYFTMVGYFNSLRELGGAVRLIEDDVRTRILKTLAKPDRPGQKYKFAKRLLMDTVPELTSRVDSREIPVILDQLDRPYTGAPQPKEPPVDVVLASNMISVGVDVGRLGLMVVTGQPKTTAEYIQATSRVGRLHPGLVITVYNWARPRDLSHYERFHPYHAALYRYVEAISVTPFSSRARDRALAGTVIAMVRHRVPGLAHTKSAHKFKLSDPSVALIRKRILDRVTTIDKTIPLEDVTRDLDTILDRWQNEALKGGLAYGGEKNAANVIFPLGQKQSKDLFGVPNSMRDVEQSVGLYLLEEKK